MTKSLSQFFLFCCLMLAAYACNQEPQLELKHDVSVLKLVMQDLYIADAALKDIQLEQKDSLRTLYLKQIEEIHQIKISEVEKDIHLLQKHPRQYNKIHAEVRDSITMLEKRLSSKDQ